MTKKSFLHLLTKEISETISPDEQKLLNESRKENRVFDQVYTEMHRFMQSDNKQKQPVDVEAKLNEVWNRINAVHDDNVITLNNPEKRKRIVPIWTRVAASIAIILGLGLLTYKYLPQQQLYAQTIEAGNENLYTVLDDGTQVWLSKNSKLSYNKDFGKDRRAIKLTGEAFFDVAHRPEVPLTVTANEVDITVKGTAFNVNAEQPDVEVALIRGLVAVKDTRQKNADEILLHPNQKMIVKAGQTTNKSNYVVSDIQKTESNLVTEIEWINDLLVFNKQRFADVAKLMESRFDVKITFHNSAIAEQRFTGSIKDESLTQMLDALKQSYPFEYEINGKNIIIK